ncbi:MAG: hypothetical protein WCC92_03715 [Candidatus Korobacteraceae bacterium]
MSANSSVQEVAAPSVLRNLCNSALLQMFALLLLFSAAAWYEALHLSALTNSDIWWRLRTGIWILQNYAVPHTGLFSQYPDFPWIASSWLFDVLLAAAYKLLALRALPVLLMAFKVTVAVVTFALARGSRLNFWPAVVLAAAAQYVIPGLPPGPVVCSIVLFAIELALLFSSRRTGTARPLFWLPLLFALWADLDIGFMFGLLALLLFCAVVFAEQVGRRSAEPRTISLRTTAMVTAASIIATFFTPYSFHLYAVASRELWSVAPYVHELRAITFRRPQDYALLLLAMAACFALGRRRSRDLFQILLMAGCLALAFTRQRDTWLLVLASVAVIANALDIGAPSTGQEESTLPWKWKKLATAGLVLVAFVLAITRIPSSREALLNKVAETFPVRACDYIRAKHLPTPLFNAYHWGGFLTWYLPEYPVSIDGRVDLYGEEINSRYFKLIIAAIPLNADPSFAKARTILLPRNSPMAVALSALPQFRVAYQDDVATVLLQGG